MRSMVRWIILGAVILALPLQVNAQCTGHCDGACLKTAADAFVRSATENAMYVMAIEDLAKMIDGSKTDVLVVDVRSDDMYAQGHIKGSINVPLDLVIERLSKIPEGKKIAVVCSMERRSAYAVAVLRMHKRDAWIVEGGIREWESLGRKLVK